MTTITPRRPVAAPNRFPVPPPRSRPPPSARDSERPSEERLDLALAASGLGLWDWDLATGELYLDVRASGIIGRLSSGVGPHFETLIKNVHCDDALPVARALEDHLQGRTRHFDVEPRLQGPAGDWRWVHVRGQVSQRDDEGQPIRANGTLRDIDVDRRAALRLERAADLSRLLLQSTDEGIVGLDAHGAVQFINPAALRLLGCTEPAALHQSHDLLFSQVGPDDLVRIGHDSPIVRCLLLGRAARGADDRFDLPNGRRVPVEYSVSPLAEAGRITGAVLVFRDISARRALADRLRHQADHDPLTGLLNRRGFHRHLTAQLERARNAGEPHALCFIDLDHFKVVNDTGGHAAGDALLRQLPVVLRQVPMRGHLARLGGDEFAWLLPDCTIDRAASAAASIGEALARWPFRWQGRRFTIGASIGVVGLGRGTRTADRALAAADAACYVAKEGGRGGVHVLRPGDPAARRQRGQLRWVARLRRALAEHDFRLWCQDIMQLGGDGGVRHHELLLRHRDASGRLSLPAAFLPAAERWQLMDAIDAWVVSRALPAIAALLRDQPSLANHRFGINLSGPSLRNGRLTDRVERTLAECGLSPQSLYFEVTETAAIADLDAAAACMHRLHDLGCKLALDDFGSGMSSFAWLKRLPLDYLKIDGGFIRDIVRSPLDRAIVRAIQSVCAARGVRTVAEYVGDAATLNCVRRLGVHYAQGFEVARPRPLAALIAR